MNPESEGKSGGIPHLAKNERVWGTRHLLENEKQTNAKSPNACSPPKSHLFYRSRTLEAA